MVEMFTGYKYNGFLVMYVNNPYQVIWCNIENESICCDCNKFIYTYKLNIFDAIVLFGIDSFFWRQAKFVTFYTWRLNFVMVLHSIRVTEYLSKTVYTLHCLWCITFSQYWQHTRNHGRKYITAFVSDISEM